MGNPQHLEWLLEGVEAWNARRKRDDFVPNFEGVDISTAFVVAGKLDEFGRAPLEGANLKASILSKAILDEADLEWADFEGATLIGAKLEGTNLQGAGFRLADLEAANLDDASLEGTDFEQANLKIASLSGARLDGAYLLNADLRGADLSGANLKIANLAGANIRTVFPRSWPSNSQTKNPDLSIVFEITQEQLDTMLGDTGVILPEGLVHPAHWPDPQPPEPELPDQEDPSDLGEKNGKLSLIDLAPPARQDLEDMQQDLREDVVRFRAAGGLHNVSVDLDSVVIRFAGIVDRAYGEMDQIRFGVQASALRKRFEGESDEIKQIDPAKHGALGAILMVAELLSSRLPKYQGFLAETQKDRAIVEDHAEEVGDALADAADALAADPEHFDGSLTERLQEYWTTKTTEAYLAGTTLLNDAAFVVFRAVRDFVRETGTESRKLAVKGLAKALVAGVGSVLAKLAGLIPAEFEWILPWLKYIPTIFG